MPWLKRSQQAYQPTIGVILFLLITFILGMVALGWGWVEFNGYTGAFLKFP